MLIEAMQRLYHALASEQIDARDLKISVESMEAWGRLLWILQRDIGLTGRFEGNSEKFTIAGIEFSFAPPPPLVWHESAPIDLSQIDAETIQRMMAPGGLGFTPNATWHANPLRNSEPDPIRNGEPDPIRTIGELSTDILAEVERRRAEKPYANAFDVTKSMIEGGE